MNKLPLTDILSRKGPKTKENVRNIARLSMTSKSIHRQLKPLLNKLKQVQNMYRALPKRRGGGGLAHLTPANYQRVMKNFKKFPFVLTNANKRYFTENYWRERRDALKALKNADKKTVTISPRTGRITFVLARNGSRYNLSPSGNLRSFRTSQPYVLFRGVSPRNIVNTLKK